MIIFTNNNYKYNIGVMSDFIRAEYIKASLGIISSNDFFKYTCKWDEENWSLRSICRIVKIK